MSLLPQPARRKAVLSVTAIVFCQLVAAAMVTPALPDDFTDASQAMCEKVKGCALSQMGQESSMSEEMKAMVMRSLESMCDQMNQSFSAVARYHELYEPATACMRSMSELSCQEIDAANENATDECAAYERAAEKYR
ncbi:MAG: hypothetical protein H6888_01735 [Nitratireductor sp.]|nr:hypothetical protein [Nitratireductor sp.]MCC0019773.1 hypothetical protein [Nitratireductor sp.]